MILSVNNNSNKVTPIFQHASSESLSIKWQWNIDESYFYIESELLKKRLHLEQTVSTIDDFIHILSIKSQRDLRRLGGLVKKMTVGEQIKPIRICFTTIGGSLSYCLLSAKLSDIGTISGEILPLFTSTHFGEFSSFFEQIFENQHHGMVLTDESTAIVACNEEFEASTQYSLMELIGKETRIFNANKHGELYFVDMWEKINTEGFWIGLILSKRKDGLAIPQELTIQRVTSIQEKIYYIGMCRDLSNSLYRIAGREYGGIELLTQLPCDDDFAFRLYEYYLKMDVTNGLMVLSFEPKFAIDNILEQKREIASVLSYRCDNTLSGYLYGSVFMIAITFCQTQNKPLSLSILQAIKEKLYQIRQEVDDVVYQLITDSVLGVSVLGLDTHDPHDLIPHSLHAMREKHSNNRLSKVCFYSDKLHDKVKTRQRSEKIVVNAIQSKSVEVYFQPIINSDNWQVGKFEALCRFRDQNGSLLNTQEMVRIAEELNLVDQLDLVVAEKAIQKRQQLIMLYGRDIEVTINISLNTEKPSKLIFEDLNKLFDRYVSDLPYLTVELTESAYFDSEEIDSMVLTAIRTRGVKIAIDDFGTGFSSFTYLKDSNFDILKIDREFVKNITVGSANFHIVKMITNLAHTLDVEVVAEGVETIQEVVLLKSLGVDLLQGFYFSKPKSLSNVESPAFYLNKLKDLSSLSTNQSRFELVQLLPSLEPESSLQDIKAIFDNTDFSIVPIVKDSVCVGYIDVATYNLHITPSLGSPTETSSDLSFLHKKAETIMIRKMVTVHETIVSGEVHEKINNGYDFPWVVIDDMGRYTGVIETKRAYLYLNNL